MNRKLIIGSLFVALMIPVFAAFGQGVIQWASWGGSGCELNGNLVPVNAIVQAVDNDGVVCGEQIFSSPGLYQFMAVYLDDPTTPEDDGCSIGESLDFYINGIQATEGGPDDDVWEDFGDTKIMQLAIFQDFGVSLGGDDGGLGEIGTTVQYSVYVKNDGNGTDRFVVSGFSSSKGWTVAHDAAPGGFYVPATDSVEVIVSVQVPGSAVIGEQDDLTFEVTSQFSPSNSTSKIITTTADEQTSVDDLDYVIPGEFRLQQNYPNPFNPQTTISFNLEKSADIRLEVFDILGRKQATLYDGYLGAGEHSFTWRGVDAYGRAAASGIYFYRLSSSEYSLTRKMTLLK